MLLIFDGGPHNLLEMIIHLVLIAAIAVWIIVVFIEREKTKLYKGRLDDSK